MGNSPQLMALSSPALAERVNGWLAMIAFDVVAIVCVIRFLLFVAVCVFFDNCCTLYSIRLFLGEARNLVCVQRTELN